MDAIAAIRRFSRTVTQQFGALDSSYLGRKRPLAASRLLFEVGYQGAEIRDLRYRLALDSGYMARLLRTLEAEGLVAIDQSQKDARVRLVALTAEGRRELKELNRLSDQAAASTLEALTPKQQIELTRSMTAVERLLTASAVAIMSEDPSSSMAQECLLQYYRELSRRLENGFDPTVSSSISPEEMKPPRGVFVLATLHGEAVGCGAVRFYHDFVEVKRMWVSPSARGLGIGRRILSRLEDLARRHSYETVRLDTNRVLSEAKSLYEKTGYREIPRYNDNRYADRWYEKKL
jgi:DNA-binding MarR family transcriptional regulator/GNAT superfamily N-acetyltransferase